MIVKILKLILILCTLFGIFGIMYVIWSDNILIGARIFATSVIAFLIFFAILCKIDE